MSDAITSNFVKFKRCQTQNQRKQIQESVNTLMCEDSNCEVYFDSTDGLQTHYSESHPKSVPADESQLAGFWGRKLNDCAIQNSVQKPTSTATTNVKVEAIKMRNLDESHAAGNVVQKTSALSLGAQVVSDPNMHNSARFNAGRVSQRSSRRFRATPRVSRTANVQRPKNDDPEFEPAHRSTGRLFNADKDDYKTFNSNTQAAQTQPHSLAFERNLERQQETRNIRPREGTIEHQHIQTKHEARPVIMSPQTSNTANGEAVNSKDRPPQFQTGMVLQPETRPIGSEQLIAEVKGIYAGLIMVEAKCSEVDDKQLQITLEMDGQQPKLNRDQWQALVALHRTLLHEHHDFFLATQHPSASPSLKRLASKYEMPARMWRHGIHNFLELLRHRLPDSLDHMLTFIVLAYNMMALLYETVPAFEDTWLECLGDLSRYRMAIEDDDVRDREVWQNVARFWYQKAADKTPGIGRLYHHIAILARPNILSQLFYYCKSLSVGQPFSSARESILTVFDPISNPELTARNRPVGAWFALLHSISFTRVDGEKFDEYLDDFLSTLDKHISRPTSRWKVQGCHIAVCNITALFQYGSRDSLLRKAYKEGRKQPLGEEEEQHQKPENVGEPEPAIDSLLPPYDIDTRDGNLAKEFDKNIKYENTIETNEIVEQSMQKISLDYAKKLAFGVLALTLERDDDGNVMPHLHAWLIFILHLTGSVPAMRLLENDLPWQSLVDILNKLLESFGGENENINIENFPRPAQGIARPLPEDYTLRGLAWTLRYFPKGWFEEAQIDNEERALELPSMANIRKERILWLGMKICAHGDWILFDDSERRFEIHSNLALRQKEVARKREIMENRQRKKMSTMSMGNDDDIEMGAVGCSNSEDESYVLIGPKVLRDLKEQKKQLEAQLQAASGAVVASERTTDSTIVKGQDAVKWNYTAFVVDTNLLVSHLETFTLITNKGWTVIVPNCVIIELHGLGNNSGLLGDSAKSAVIAINKAVTEKKDVKIITSKGNDVTKAGFYREKLEKNEDEIRNLDDVIIQTTKQQSELRTQNLAPGGNAEAAILLTEDTNMRVRANARKVPAISTTVLKRYIVKIAQGGSPSPRIKRKSPAAQPLLQAQAQAQAQLNIKQEHDHDMNDADDIKDPQPDPGGRRRVYKHRRTDR